LLVKGHKPSSIRFLLTSVPYRKQLNFTFAGLEQGAKSVERLRTFDGRMRMSQLPAGTNPVAQEAATKARQEMRAGMEDDLNTARASAAIFDMVREANTLADRGELREGDKAPLLEALQQFDEIFLYGWDERLRQYLAFMAPSGDFRVIGRSTSDDSVQWSVPTPVLVPGEGDPPGAQFYKMSVFADRGVYFGLLSVYHADSLMIDVHLVFSRDSIAWRPLGGRAPILTYGLPDSFDSHCLYALTPLVVGDEIRVYYAAEDEAHPLARQDVSLQTHAVSRAHVPLDEQSWLRRRRGYGGLATCRRDGFVSLDAARRRRVVTKAFRCRETSWFSTPMGQGNCAWSCGQAVRPLQDSRRAIRTRSSRILHAMS
jgi:hypothetical protein